MILYPSLQVLADLVSMWGYHDCVAIKFCHTGKHTVVPLGELLGAPDFDRNPVLLNSPSPILRKYRQQ